MTTRETKDLIRKVSEVMTSPMKHGPGMWQSTDNFERDLRSVLKVNGLSLIDSTQIAVGRDMLWAIDQSDVHESWRWNPDIVWGHISKLLNATGESSAEAKP